MIDPFSDVDRGRLAKSHEYWHREHDRYRKARRESIMMFTGSTQFASAAGATIKRGDRDRVFGNLMQLQGRAHQTRLAYGEPRFTAIAESPIGDPIAPRLEGYLNRYTKLLNLGDIARQMALDSFFGFGIVWTDVGLLPRQVQIATGKSVGPMCWRVSNDNFMFDGDALTWDEVSYFTRFSYPALSDAIAYYSQYGDAEVAASLTEYGVSATTTDGRLNPGTPRLHSALARTRLAHVYLPDSNKIVVWPANDQSFNSMSGKPLMVADYTGHYLGPATVLNMLDIPDNLLPITLAESTKRLHILFQEIGDLTSEQARNARFNPIYEVGAQRDIDRVLQAQDRKVVGVSNIAKMGAFTIPGPDQGQTSYLNALHQLFKQFADNLDDQLGLAPTAGTATQSNLIRQATSAQAADARRRMDRAMELIALKLGQLALNDPDLTLPMRREVPGTQLTVDNSWLPASAMPRSQFIDDFDIKIVPESMEYRPPGARLQQLNEAVGQIFQAFQLASNGVPIDLPNFIETQAKYRNLPELRGWFAGLLPEYQAQKNAVALDDANKPNGQYTRTNVSERSDAGALTQALTQFGGGGQGGGLQLAAT